MNQLPRKGTRLLVGLALAGLVSAACVKSDPPGVALREVKTSAKFGFEEKDKKLPDFDVPEDSALAAAVPLPELPSSSFEGRSITKKLKIESICPEALEDAFPKEAATVQVKGMPTEGAYTWKSEVTKIDRVARRFLGQTNLESRFIRGVTRNSANEFKFQMIAPEAASSNVVITSFLVNNNPALLVNRRVDARTVLGAVDIPGYDLRVTPPNDEPGVFITKIETRDSKNVTAPGGFNFTPVRPMLILPLEEGIVRTGQTFSSYAVDPTTGDTLLNEGIVGGQTRIDACGEIVEGYAVTLEQSYTRDVNRDDPATEAEKYGSRQLTRTQVFNFATQYGMLPIGDILTIGKLSDRQGLIARRSLGALTPKPLPPSAK